MSWRGVTKDDVGKMVEVRDKEAHDWKVRELEHILSRPDGLGQRYLVWGEDKQYPLQYRYARIRTSPLPDGWMPDGWRVLGDEETTQKHDIVVFKKAIEIPFDEKTIHSYELDQCWSFSRDTNNAGYVSKTCDHHLCVIRPRWRPATKDDVGKHVSSGIDMGQLKIILNEPDDDGHDCIVYFGGWCVSALKDLKVENEGWHVTK
jgi:hypothetical protein